jgi:hypothetical protein
MRHLRTPVPYLVLSLLAAAGLVGCGDDFGGRMEVTGRVTLEGEPLKDGQIRFVPLANQGTEGGASIADGEYRVPRQNGLKPGKYLIQITSGDGKTPAADEEAGAPGGSTNIVSFDLVPEDWNVTSKHEVEVKSSGSNKFDFDIPTKNVPKPKKKKR